MSQELQTIIDLIRYGASRFNAAGLTFGHGYDNALDEATQLTLHALHLPHDLSPVYGNARITEAEKEEVLGLFLRRIEEHVPAAYLTGEAWFAGLSFKSDPRALVPRSPIAEMIEALDKVTPGIASDETLLYGVEVKFYSNKVVVDKDFCTSVKGLRAIGDGASVTRGLQQASANGLSVARSILKSMK